MKVTTESALQMVTGDLDGDGDADLGFLSASGSLEVSRGDGHGAFSTPSTVAGPAAGERGMTVGDFDGDGASEIAVLAVGTGPAGPSGSIAVWPFAPGTTPYHADASFLNGRIAAGDVDGDGRDDLVLTTNAVPGFTDGSDLEIYHSTGAGFTSAASVRAGGEVGEIALRDADADGPRRPVRDRHDARSRRLVPRRWHEAVPTGERGLLP